MLPPIVDHAWLSAHRDEVLLADVRFYLDGSSARDAYDAGHLPGAVYVDLERWLTAPGTPEDGRHPLPTPEVFAEGMTRCGIGDDTRVVAYDDAGGVIAARLAWMLRALGRDAALLDGGLEAWSGERETVEQPVTPGSFTARPWPAERLASADETAAAADPSGGGGTGVGSTGAEAHVTEADERGASAGSTGGGAHHPDSSPHGSGAGAGGGGGGRTVVIDARQRERFAGAPDGVDPRFGHIPGARSLPCREHLGEDGRLLPLDELRARLQHVGIDDAASVISYCGSGVTACHNLLVIEHAGFGAHRLYPGSWSQWAHDAARPVATGDD